MKITQVKPIVIGYHKIEFAGKKHCPVFLLKKHNLASMAMHDLRAKKLNPTGERSKFRPVYAGNEETVIDRFSEEWV